MFTKINFLSVAYKGIETPGCVMFGFLNCLKEGITCNNKETLPYYVKVPPERS